MIFTLLKLFEYHLNNIFSDNRKRPRQDARQIYVDQPAANPVAQRLQEVTAKSLRNFQIDWDRFNPETLKMLDSGSRDPSLVQSVVKDIISELHVITNNKSLKIDFLKSVAEEMVKTYPDTFEDRFDDGTPIVQDGPSCAALLLKLKNRNNNQCRKKNRNSLLRKIKTPTAKIQLASIVQHGCQLWQPDYPPNETEESLEAKKEYLRLYLTYDFEDHDTLTKITDYIDDTYCIVRLFLNNLEAPPTFEKITQEWPIMLAVGTLRTHFSKLTGIKWTSVSQEMHSNVSLLLSYGVLNQLCDSSGFTGKEDKLKAAFKLICKHFNEDLTNIFGSSPVSKMYIVFLKTFVYTL